MHPTQTGHRYDKIADWWHQQHQASDYGLAMLRKAIGFHTGIRTALDIGCGAGGRFVDELTQRGSSVHGIDVSEKMIALAQQQHPALTCEVQDICEWTIPTTYDLIYAWDSIFHVPLAQHPAVIHKMCRALRPGGILFYTFGRSRGEHTDTWMEDTFYYSSIGITENIQLLLAANLTILHLELDQYPNNHVVVIAQATTA